MNAAVKQEVARRLMVICTISFVVIIVLLPVHAFFSTWLGTAIGPLLVWKSWKEILLALLVPCVGIYGLMRPDITRLLWSRWVNKLIAVYVVLHLLLAVFSQASSAAVVAALLMNLRFLAMFVLAQFIVAAEYPYVERLKKWLPTWLLWTMIGLAVIAIAQVTILPKHLLDVFGYNKDTTIAPLSLVDSDPNALRAFATMRGPNTLGAYLLIPLAFAMYYITMRRRVVLAGIALTLGLIALVLTDSRSAWIGFAATVLAFALLLLPRDKVKTWARRALIPAIALVVLLAISALTVPAIRLAVFHSTAKRSSLVYGSTQDHWLATYTGIKDIVMHPLGTGAGSAGPASFYNKNAPPSISEDYFVQIGQEVGIIGLFLFLAINVLVARDLLRARTIASMLLLASFVGLSIINLFLHGWADDPTAMTWWGLAGLFIGGSHSGSGFASATNLRTSARAFFRHARKAPAELS